jgi:hypothetical protein
MLSFFGHAEPVNQPKVEILLRKELKHTIVQYRRDGIICIIYKSGNIITVDDCHEIAKFIALIGVADKYNILTEPQEGVNITDEARALLASKLGNRFTLKNAILCSSIIHEMIGNFFIRMNQPYAPTKLFISKAEAIEWLIIYNKS